MLSNEVSSLGPVECLVGLELEKFRSIGNTLRSHYGKKNNEFKKFKSKEQRKKYWYEKYWKKYWNFIYIYIYIYLITLCNTDKVGRKKYQFQIFVADIGQKRTSFKTVSHNHLLTIKVSKSIFFGSNMGQTKQKLFEWDFPGFSARSCYLHLEHIFLQNNSKEFWARSLVVSNLHSETKGS